jgi:glucans biosynthesis protein C
LSSGRSTRASWERRCRSTWLTCGSSSTLLIYSLAFAAWRSIRPNASQPILQPRNLPGYGSVVVFALTMALATAIVRTWYSIDEWVYLGGYLRVAYADVPRDLSLFLVGILAYRQQWVTRFPTRAGYVWLASGLTLAGLWYAYEILLADIITFSDTFWGLFIPVWESLLCVAMSIGLTVLFRERVNAQGPLAKELANSSYMAFMLHLFVVILFQYLAIRLPGPPLAKFFLVTLDHCAGDLRPGKPAPPAATDLIQLR